MDKRSLDTDIIFTVSAILVLLIGLAGFIIYFIVLYRKKQMLNLIEKEKAALQYQQELLWSLMEVQEQTRQTIGADLHDNIGQLLSLTSFTLKSIEKKNIATAMSKVDTAIQLVGRSIKEMRLLGKLLEGEQIVSRGLEVAIEHEVKWVERSEKFKVAYEVIGEYQGERNFERDLITFRIVQECLSNIIKHSEAEVIEIKLEYGGELTCLRINDNGKGFDMSTLNMEAPGMGIMNIHRRVALLKGEVKIISALSDGTSIIIQLPYS